MDLQTNALIVFAVIFFIVGVFRIVEFKEAGISKFQRLFLVPLHISGCAVFAGAIALLGLDPGQKHMTLMTILFFSGFLLLVPIHIYVAIKRKIKLTP